MSAYPPINRQPAIFNPLLYGVIQGGDFLTLQQADSRYLKLSGGSLNGQLTINNDLSADDIFVNDGSVSNPSISFRDDTDTGIYSSANGVIDFTNNGIQSLTLTQSELVSRNRILLQDGTSGTPSLSFFNEQNTGFFRNGNHRLDVRVNGNTPLSLRNAETHILDDLHLPKGAVNGYILSTNGSGKASWIPLPSSSSVSLVDGSSSAPSLNFLSSTTTGMYYEILNSLPAISFTSGGTKMLDLRKYDGLTFGTGGLRFYNGIIVAYGDTTSKYTYIGHDNTNAQIIYRTGDLVFADNGVQRFRINSSQTRCEGPFLAISDITCSSTNGYVALRRISGDNASIDWNIGDLLITRALNTEIARFTLTAAYVKKPLILGNAVGGETLLTFNTERSWFITSGFSGSGSATSLDWCSTAGGKDLNILINDTSLATNLRFKFGTSSGTFTTYNGGDPKCELSTSVGITHYGDTTGEYIRMRHDGTNGRIEVNTGIIQVYNGTTLTHDFLATGMRFYDPTTTSRYLRSVCVSNECEIQFFGVSRIKIVNTGGTGVQLNSGNTSWSSISDRRLKKNIQEIEPVLEKLKHIKSYKYNLECEECPNDELKPSKYGFIADEVEVHFSEIVDFDGEYQSLRYTEMIPVLCKGIVELDVKCEGLRTENETLTNEVSALRTELNDVKSTLQSVLERLTQLEQRDTIPA